MVLIWVFNSAVYEYHILTAITASNGFMFDFGVFLSSVLKEKTNWPHYLVYVLTKQLRDFIARGKRKGVSLEVICQQSYKRRTLRTNSNS